MGVEGPASPEGSGTSVIIYQTLSSAGAAVTGSGNNCKIVNVRVWVVWSGSTGDVLALDVASGSRVIAEACSFEITGPAATGGNAYAIRTSSGATANSEFRNCTTAVSGGATKKVGYYAVATAKAQNCLFTGDTSSVELNGGAASWEFGSCRMPNGLVNTAASSVKIYGDSYIPTITGLLTAFTFNGIPLSQYAAKTTPIGADLLMIGDSADSYKNKKVTWSQLPTIPFSKIRTVDATDPAADYSTITAALAAAGAGDVILVGPGTYNEAATLSPSVLVTIQGAAGSGRSDTPATIINLTTSTPNTATIDTIGGGAGVILKDLRVKITWQGSSGWAAALAAGASLQAENCIFEQVNSGATGGDGYGFYESAMNTCNFYNCQFKATGTFNHYGYYTTTVGLSYFWNCTFEGTDAAIYPNHASAQLTCIGGRVIDTLNLSTVTGTGAIYFIGTWITGTVTDPNSVLQIRGIPLTSAQRKVTPTAADRFLIYDSTDTPKFKALQFDDLAAFRLREVAGPTNLSMATITDGQYFRRSGLNVVGGGGLSPYAKVWTVDATDPNADFTTIAAAITAASAGDVIMIGPGTYNESLNIGKSLTLQGAGGAGRSYGPATQILNTSSTTGAYTITSSTSTVYLKDLYVKMSWSGASGTAAALLLSTGSSFTAENCYFELSGGSGTTVGSAVQQAGTGNHYFYGCRFFGFSGSGGNLYDYNATGSGAVLVYDTIFDWVAGVTDACIFAGGSSVTLYNYNCRVAGAIDLTNQTAGLVHLIYTTVEGTITDPNKKIVVESLNLIEVGQNTSPTGTDRLLVYDSKNEPVHVAVRMDNLIAYKIGNPGSPTMLGMPIATIGAGQFLQATGGNIVGANGVTGATGPTGPGLGPLQDGYNRGATVVINQSLGPIVIMEPSNGMSFSRGVLFRVAPPSFGQTDYFTVVGTGHTSNPAGIYTSGKVVAKRLDLDGTALVGANFSLARFGSGASAAGNYGVTNIIGDDSRGCFTVVTGVTGYTSYPRVWLNFVDGNRGETPNVIHHVDQPANPTLSVTFGSSGKIALVTVSPTNVQWVFLGAPSARAFVTVRYLIIC